VQARRGWWFISKDAERLAKDCRAGLWEGSFENVSRETFSSTTDPNMLELEAQLRNVFGTKVCIVKNKDRGRIEIHFYTDDDLGRILILLVQYDLRVSRLTRMFRVSPRRIIGQGLRGP